MARLTKIMDMLEKTPDDAFLHFGLAMELMKEGRTEDALERFDRVLQIDPTYTAAHFHKGNTLIGLKRTDEAREILTAGLQATIKIGNKHAQREMQELIDSIG